MIIKLIYQNFTSLICILFIGYIIYTYDNFDNNLDKEYTKLYDYIIVGDIDKHKEYTKIYDYIIVGDIDKHKEYFEYLKHDKVKILIYGYLEQEQI